MAVVLFATELVTVRLRESTIWFLPGRRSQRSSTFDVRRGGPPPGGGGPGKADLEFSGIFEP